ncbi:MAG TPA: SH3 domain-containing protein [Acidimicrobiales bacterium]|nr:SH3 domain-containing protein [Acidimicrobiales bacterium]
MAWIISGGRAGRRPRRLSAALAVLAGATAGCSIGGHTSSPTTSRASPATSAAVTSTTAPGPQTSGQRTVLSPVGLNVRASPSPSAKVLGTARQGVALTVVGYNGSGGGWFQVKGQTVTGWISAKPTLSAPGVFRSYSNSAFGALYPATWSESDLAVPAPTSTTSPAPPPASTGAPPQRPSSVAFRPASGPGDIVVTSAGSLSQLPHGRAGYGTKSVSDVVVCGVTAGLVVYERVGAPATTTAAAPGSEAPQSLAYLAEVRFAVDKQHALALYADMPDLGPTLDVFKQLAASVTFSGSQCVGG